MDFLVGSVRRHLSGARNKSRSLPLYTKAGPETGAEHLSGTQGDPTLSPLEKRISSSSPKLAWTSQQSQGLDRRPQHSKRRNSSSCLPTPGQRSDSDGSPSDTTSCSSLEFLPGSSFKTPAQEQTDQACKSTSVYRRGRLEALKARVTAQRNKYKNDSSSSSSSDAEGERTPCETGRTVLPRFHSDETLHRAGRGRSSRRAKRRSQDLEALSRNPVTRSDPQLPHDNRSPVTWQESSAYLEPRRLQTDDSPSQSASEDIPSPPRKSNPLVLPQKKYSLPSTRKPLTVSVHGLVGHIPPASPCDSGLGTHSITSSPSLGRAPTPPLRSPKPESVVHRLPPSLNSIPGSQGEGSPAVWWRKRQSLLSQLSTSRSDIASPRPGARVYAYTDQAPRPPSAYLSDSQVEPGRNHTEEFNRKLGVWKAMESTSGSAVREHASNGEVSRSSGVWTENRNVNKSNDTTANGGKILSEVCRSRSVIWPKDFSNGVSRSPVLENSPRNSPLAWARKDTGTPPATIRTLTPLSAKTDMGSNAESTPKTSPVPPRLWSPPVQTRNPNRISAAEALGVTAAIPVPPTRIGSLDTARRNMDALVDKERRRRCSEHLEDALQELETIYQSLRLNEDEELLDRAERRDMPEWRPAGSRQWQKRYSIADPTGGFPLVRSYSDQASRLRRSAVPDKVADDLAVRKLQQRPSTPRNKVSPDTTSYLLCSPIYTPSLIVQPATRDVTALNEPDPEIDDVGYRKFVQGQRHQLAPHPPFGIPLEPSPQSPAGGYIHASESVHAVPDWRSSRKNVEPDLQRDDLAYRNLRRESVFLRSGSRRSVSALSDLEEWARPVPLRPTEPDDSMASIIAALEGLGGQRSPPPPVPKRRSVPGSGQKRLHGLTLRA